MSIRFSAEDIAEYQRRMGQWKEASNGSVKTPFTIPEPPPPTEDQEQRIVAQFLDLLGFRWFHPPNGGSRNIIEAKKFKGLGVRPGVPDIIIVDRPPDSDYVGCCVELKRQKGGRISDDQREWLDALTERGWMCRCCAGADEAIKFIREVYGK